MTTEPSWHAAPPVLAAYAQGRADIAEAWSLEAHLIDCSSCRQQLAAHLGPFDDALLTEQRERLLQELPARVPGYRRAALRWLRWVLRPGPLAAVAVTVAVVALLDALTMGGGTQGGLVWLLAPAIPVAGVALVSVSEDDPCREAVLAAPDALLRLTLWRSLALLAVAIPVAAGLSLVRAAVGGNAGWSDAWLLPSVALTASALALGAVIGVQRAARAVALLWCAAALAPALVRTGGAVVSALRLAAEAPALLSGTAQVVWAVVTVIAVAAIAVLRDRFEQLGGAR
ncbi:hypothetical protein [Actinoplanes sp. NPDC049265]|uniref:hypothetical protein n=1 Tax=Actinoplanes sp. NPDC049265 TaxID=3363902 RepID=UPI00371A85BA